jgi:hypothetical protein
MKDVTYSPLFRFTTAVAGRVLKGEVCRFCEEHPLGRRFVDHIRDGKAPLDAAVEVACEFAAERKEQG